MKKVFVFLLLLAVTVNFASFASAANSTCEDSDKSINYNVKGTAKGNWFKDLKETGSYSDSCVVEGEKALNEYYCDEAAVAIVKYNCPVACEDGACVKQISPPQICEDSDSNQNDVKGSVSAKTFNASWSGSISVLNATTARSDYCVNISSPAENLGECSGGDCGVVELTCVQSGRNQIGVMAPLACQYGCKDGACMKAPKIVEKPAPECSPIGNITGTKYCTSEEKWADQKASGQACSQNYECSTNICTEKVCKEPIKPGFFSNIWNWIKGLFGK
ncbi:hypothetical protein FJZ18_00870 [Candidatus Pacearchaeota archaeon]|nr:hypothetical protein [Candidatus Pacearchaeota archaeon]